MSWKIRLIAAKELRYILPLCRSASNTTELTRELHELLDEDDSLVKVDALETFATIIGYIDREMLVQDFGPIIKKMYEEHRDECLQTLSLCSGRILNGYLLEGEEIKTVIIEFYKVTLEIDDSQVRINAFYNLPFFYKEFGLEIDFKQVFEKVTTEEEEPEVLQILAMSLHHLFEITAQPEYEDKRLVLRKMLDLFLVSTDTFVQRSIAENL